MDIFCWMKNNPSILLVEPDEDAVVDFVERYTNLNSGDDIFFFANVDTEI